MLRVAVVDDEGAARELYSALARDWARRRGVEAHVVAFASAEQLLFSLDDAPCDIALLDIEMEGLDGMSLARELRSRGELTQIVFVTGIIDHALDGYDVDAVSYLLKPVRAEKLDAALDRALDRVGREEPVLVVESAGETSRVPL
ncbi:MAG TPA: response regulator, partial [Candidatus Olsenella pullicola]|nr:response regulator [Candidatus Olsenella pullicola]